jgi:DNA invertase Pin-like site-specific DNA recombinase
MSTNALATAAARKAKAPRKPGPKLAKKSQHRAATKPVSAARVKHPYERIAAMYNDGKSWNEIADACKIKRTSMNGISDRLAVGVKVGDKVIKIKRG